MANGYDHVAPEPSAFGGYRQAAWPWAILTLGVVLRLLVASQAMGASERRLSPDSLSYLTLAENLCAGHGFSADTGPPWAPSTFRTPGYPAFIALVGALFVRWRVDVAVIAVQAALVLVSGAALLRIASNLGLDGKSRLAVSGVLALDPVAIGLSSMILSETLFACLVALALLLWIDALRDQRPLTAFLSGAAIGGLALVRPVAAYLWLGPVLTVLGSPGTRARRFLRATLVVAGAACVTGPWVVRNHSLGAGLSVSSMSRSQMIEWQAAIIESRARGLSREAVAHEYSERYGNQASGPDVLLDVVTRYPLAAVTSATASFGFFFLDPGHQVLLRPLGMAATGLFAERPATPGALLSRLRARPGGAVLVAICVAWILLLLAIALIGARRSARHVEWRDYVRWPALFTTAYFACLSLEVVLAEGSRLRAPILPCLALLAAIAVGAPPGEAAGDGAGTEVEGQ